MERILSEKKREQIILNGFFYRLDRKLVSGKESWRCVDEKCKGRIHVDGGGSWKTVTEHNHVPQPAVADVKNVLHRIRERELLLRIIYQEELSKKVVLT